jgi:hypothetical protein
VATFREINFIGSLEIIYTVMEWGDHVSDGNAISVFPTNPVAEPGINNLPRMFLI